MKRLLAFVLAALVFAPLPGVAADLRRLEAVGVVPMRAGSAAGAPRDAAVRAAVARGVEGMIAGDLVEQIPAVLAALAEEPRW